MAIKTFVTGEVLTAADTNTYLANSGLVYVTSATVGTAVSSVTVSSAFSSTYDNYKIIYTGGTAGSGLISMTLGASVTTYSNTLMYGLTFASPTYASGGASNSSAWTLMGYADANSCLLSIDLYGPNLAKYTQFNRPYVSTSNAGINSGVHATATAYTSFTLSAATLTGGTITVYGYRKA